MSPLEKNVDVLIGQFDQWFRGGGEQNEPLTPAEKAIVKTFCWFLAHSDSKNVPDLDLIFKCKCKGEGET